MKRSEFPLFEYAGRAAERGIANGIARGELRRRADGCVVARFDRRGIVRGRLRSIFQDELKALDQEVGDAFKRRQVIVNGYPAWAYFYTREDFDSFAVIGSAVHRTDP